MSSELVINQNFGHQSYYNVSITSPPGGEVAEQHEGRGDQSSERQNDQDGEHHTCSGMFTHHVPVHQLIVSLPVTAF